MQTASGSSPDKGITHEGWIPGQARNDIMSGSSGENAQGIVPPFHPSTPFHLFICSSVHMFIPINSCNARTASFPHPHALLSCLQICVPCARLVPLPPSSHLLPICRPSIRREADAIRTRTCCASGGDDPAVIHRQGRLEFGQDSQFNLRSQIVTSSPKTPQNDIVWN